MSLSNSFLNSELNTVNLLYDYRRFNSYEFFHEDQVFLKNFDYTKVIYSPFFYLNKPVRLTLVLREIYIKRSGPFYK
jgi:hypothetical protein